MTYPMPFPPGDVLSLPIDRLALELLRRVGAQSESPNRYNYLIGAKASYQNNDIPNWEAVVSALAEAYDWLILHGLVAQGLNNDTWLFITRKGHQVLDADDGLALVQAEARLDVDLHPRIATRVRSQFLLGEYELAAFAAMREVEIRVRELAGAGPRDLGVDLMKRSFAPAGPLTDASSVKSEQEATMALFWGAMGVFKNPPSHRQVDYADPTIASEVVLFADLLLRMLDERVAALEA
jgi:uncharacterized protein (TIGR02391 family)